MYTALRPYATAGVAMLGASAIAIAPVVVAPALPDIKVATPAVQLSATIDPLTPLLDLFNKSEVNFADLVGSWLEAPSPILQQIIANQIGYLGQLPDVGAILEQMGANAVAALQAPFAEDLSTLEPNHATIYDLIVNGIPGAIEPAPPQLVPLLKFTTTYLSGALVGLAGLVMNPVLALSSGIHSVFQHLVGEDADLGAALNALINIPTTVVDAFLNGGQSMNVTPLLTALGLDLPVPGMEVELAFGGLLSAGGSMFNSLNLVFGPGDVIPGQGAGLIGSLIGLTQAIAKAIGWDGEGNPLAPPLTTPEAPQRQAADTSIVAGTTVTLDTVDPAADSGAVTAEPASSTGGDPESIAAPAVSETAEDAVTEDGTEADEEAVDAEAGAETGTEADEETEDETGEGTGAETGEEAGADTDGTGSDDGGSESDSSASGDTGSDGSAGSAE